MNLTITEALVKLKTLESRIDKATGRLSVVSYKKAVDDKLTNGVTLEKDFIDKAKSDFQSLMDLMKMRSGMKSAIAESNAKTKVTIAGKEYTVTQAIEKKNSIHLEESLLSKLKVELASAMRGLQAQNLEAERKANSNVEIMLGSDKTKNKTDEAQQMYDMVYEKNKCVLVDPLEVQKLIEKKEIEIKEFLDSVDTQLVISNSTTYIDIED